MEKTCSKCHQTQPFANFYRNRRWRGGFHPWCKACLSLANKARYEKRCIERPPRYRWYHSAVRHDYFASVTTPLQAYILGLLTADGNVLASVPRITLELSMKDATLLELVRSELAPLHSIRERVRRTTVLRERTSHTGAIAFTSARMVSDLARFGVVPSKSLTIRWPQQLPSELARDYILGCFDGDGYITHTISNGYRYEIWGLVSGSPDFLRDVAAIVLQQSGIRLSGPYAKSGTNSSVLRAMGKRAMQLDKWIHQNDLGLARKCITQVSKEALSSPPTR
jgi:hypothetical protein